MNHEDSFFSSCFSNKCQTHKKRISGYCSTCSQYICESCLYEKTHSLHDYNELGSNKLEEIFQKNYNNFTTIKKYYNEYLENIKEEKEIVGDIYKKYDEEILGVEKEMNEIDNLMEIYKIDKIYFSMEISKFKEKKLFSQLLFLREFNKSLFLEKKILLKKKVKIFIF
jgi:hypothetical protein